MTGCPPAAAALAASRCSGAACCLQDDVVFFWPGVLRALEGLDPNEPYYITGVRGGWQHSASSGWGRYLGGGGHTSGGGGA